MELNIDYGDVGKNRGVERFIFKKMNKVDKFFDNGRMLNLDIRKEVTRGRTFQSEFFVDLRWVPIHGKTIYVTGRDRNFFKAAAESFDVLVEKINNEKPSFSRESVRDRDYIDLGEMA